MMDIDEICQSVRDAFRQYADEIKPRLREDGTASCEDGDPARYANCLAPLSRYLVEQWFRETFVRNLAWESRVPAVMGQLEQIVNTSSAALTSPWMPPHLLADQAFRKAITAKIEDHFAQGPERWIVGAQLPKELVLGEPLSIAADNPSIRKLAEEHPELFPQLNLIGRLELAFARAETTFRLRESNETWADWSGPYPWDEGVDSKSTECPWWLAGAEYVFQIVVEWQQACPFQPGTLTLTLPIQVRSVADWVYCEKVCPYDLSHGLKSLFERLLAGGVGVALDALFCNFVLAFVRRKIADRELEQWQNRTRLIERSLSDLTERSSDQIVTNSVGGSEVELTSPPRQKRGRGAPLKIPIERKLKALTVKGGKAQAKILYDTKYPTKQQINNVSSIMRCFLKKHQKSD